MDKIINRNIKNLIRIKKRYYYNRNNTIYVNYIIYKKKLGDNMDIQQNVQEQLNQFQQVQQQAQSIAMQKQTVSLQINEAKKALDELSKTSEDQEVYKTAGPLLIKTTKDETESELKDNIEMLEIRQKTIEKQEKRISSRLEELQASLQAAMSQIQQ